MRFVLLAIVVATGSSCGGPHTREPALRSRASSSSLLARHVATAASPLAALERSRDLDNVVVGHSSAPTVVMWLASWCGVCRDELAVFDAVRAAHPAVRWLALSYAPHEEYDGRGNPAALRALADATRWLRFVPADDALFTAFGSPPKVPTIFVYDRTGALVATFDRRTRPVPGEPELAELLRSLERPRPR